MSTDDWVSTALTDDAVVVELLLRLKQSTAAAVAPLPPPPRPTTLAWGCRQARSKPASATVKKDRDLTMRCSPTTPLSWRFSGAASSTSPSDDSSRFSDLSAGGRSKVAYINDSIACSSANKRSNSKRTKSFVELQEEESLLFRERSNLKKELDTMHVTLKKQKVKSESFKRLKTDLHQKSAFGVASKSCYADDHINFPRAEVAEASRINYVPASNNSIQVAANPLKPEKGFVLPDLNMMPSEDDFALLD